MLGAGAPEKSATIILSVVASHRYSRDNPVTFSIMKFVSPFMLRNDSTYFAEGRSLESIAAVELDSYCLDFTKPRFLKLAGAPNSR